MNRIRFKWSIECLRPPCFKSKYCAKFSLEWISNKKERQVLLSLNIQEGVSFGDSNKNLLISKEFSLVDSDTGKLQCHYGHGL